MRPVIGWKPAAPTPDLASARLRCFRPMEYLNAAGWSCELFEPAAMHRYRAVVFQKSYSDNDLAIARHLKQLGVRTLFDLCDNHFYNPLGLAELDERVDRLRRMIQAVDVVTASTPALAAQMDRPCAVVDDALDAVPGRRGSWFRRLRRRRRLVWFGNAGQDEPAFGLIDLARIRPALEALNARRPITLTVISNSRSTFERWLPAMPFPTRYVEWDTRRYQQTIAAHDLCLLPVSANPFTVCKTVNRLATALLIGVPTAADPIPSYEELRPFVLLGDWWTRLAEYLETGDHHETVRAAQVYLRQKYTPQRVVDQWSAVLHPLIA
jgi:hypothetical protein